MVNNRQLMLWDCFAEGSTECENKQTVFTCKQNSKVASSKTLPKDCQKDLLEKICNKQNMLLACKRVIANKGAGGVDGMKVKELADWLEENYEYLKGRLLAGKYKPKPVRRVEIPKKEKGETRALGIPTVVDRMIQQAIVQVLTPIYEKTFSDNSFGFRPGRSAHDAILRIQEYANEGLVWVASIDLEKFFDQVNQSKLVQLLSDSLSDGRVISLIHRYLMGGIMVDGVVMTSNKGTPQGGPLSPLLANIMLNELDKELERRGHKFVRYADDCIILKKWPKAANRVMESISKFIENKLFLKVNRKKSFVAMLSQNVKYLGYGFYEDNDGWQLYVHKKSVKAFKDKVRKILSRSNGWSLDYRKQRLKYLLYGWINYFKLAHMKYIIKRLDKWIRRKIRCVYWKTWKRTKTKYRALKKLGVSNNLAYQWANTRKSYWHIANSWILATTLTNAKLLALHWTTLESRYNEVMQTFKNRRILNGTYGGVRGRNTN